MGQKGATYLLYTGYPRTMVGRPLSLESVLDRFFSQRLYVVKKKLCGKKFRKKKNFFLFFTKTSFFFETLVSRLRKPGQSLGSRVVAAGFKSYFWAKLKERWASFARESFTINT